MSKEYTFVGDVHMKILKFKEIIDNNPKTDLFIQLGDFGGKQDFEWLVNNYSEERVKVLFGNHDYYPALNIPHSLGNFSFIDNLIFTVRGAYSRDNHMLQKDSTWFEQEQLNYREGLEAYDAYLKAKPEIVLSHECPTIVKQKVFGYQDKTVTDHLLQGMFEEHQPALWIHGHHHRARETSIEGTTFICLPELGVYNL